MTTPGAAPLVYVTGVPVRRAVVRRSRHAQPGGHNATGWQGPAQHTYTAACDGFHPPGPCPAYEKPLEFRFGPAWAPPGCGGKPRGCTNPDCPRHTATGGAP